MFSKDIFYYWMHREPGEEFPINYIILHNEACFKVIGSKDARNYQKCVFLGDSVKVSISP